MSHFSLGVITKHPENLQEILHQFNYLVNDYGHYDWYEIGGRWTRSLKVSKKDAELFGIVGTSHVNCPRERGRYRHVDGAPIDTIKWGDLNHVSTQDIRNFSATWDSIVNPDNMDTPRAQYYLAKYGTRQNYIMLSSLFITHAVLVDRTEEQDEGGYDWVEEPFESDDLYTATLAYYDYFYKIINNTIKFGKYYFIVVDCHE